MAYTPSRTGMSVGRAVQLRVGRRVLNDDAQRGRALVAQEERDRDGLVRLELHAAGRAIELAVDRPSRRAPTCLPADISSGRTTISVGESERFCRRAASVTLKMRLVTASGRPAGGHGPGARPLAVPAASCGR